LKTFMPNTISLVSTVPPLAGINCGMRCSGHLPEPRRPELRAGLDPTALSRVAPLKVNRNPVVRMVASNPLGAVWSRPSLSDVSEIKLVFLIPPYRPTPHLASSCNRGVSSDRQVSDEYLAFRLRAQQHRDKEDGQAHHCGDENRTRQADLMGGRV